MPAITMTGATTIKFSYSSVVTAWNTGSVGFVRKETCQTDEYDQTGIFPYADNSSAPNNAKYERYRKNSEYESEQIVSGNAPWIAAMH